MKENKGTSEAVKIGSGPTSSAPLKGEPEERFVQRVMDAMFNDESLAESDPTEHHLKTVKALALALQATYNEAILKARDVLQAEYLSTEEHEITNRRDCLRLACIMVSQLEIT